MWIEKRNVSDPFGLDPTLHGGDVLDGGACNDDRIGDGRDNVDAGNGANHEWRQAA